MKSADCEADLEQSHHESAKLKNNLPKYTSKTARSWDEFGPARFEFPESCIGMDRKCDNKDEI